MGFKGVLSCLKHTYFPFINAIISDKKRTFLNRVNGYLLQNELLF